MADRRVGLTGATGVLGRRLTESLLARHYEVVPFAGDIRDAPCVDRFAAGLQLVIHAAAIVPLQVVEANRAEAVAVNVGGTAQLAQAIQRNGGRMVYISTSHVYAGSVAPVHEGSPIAPHSTYGLTKYQGEQWVRRVVADHLVLRLFSYFDEHQAESFLVPGLLKRIVEAPPRAVLPIEGADNTRDLADARWVAEAGVSLIESGATGTVNLCTGVSRRVADIARDIARIAGRSDIAWHEHQRGPASHLTGDPALARRYLRRLPDFDLESAIKPLLERGPTGAIP